MARWALIEGNVISNVVDQEGVPEIEGIWIDITDQHVGPGYSYINGAFTPPPPPAPIITKIAMLTRLTDAEYVGILAAAKTDVEVEAWKTKFDAANTIDLNDSRTVAGINLLVAKGLLTQARGDEILIAEVQPQERP